jgi:hypothetical protein
MPSAPVLSFTMENMPRLECVIAMGSAAARAIKLAGLGSTIAMFRYHQVRHPAYAMSDRDRFAEWEPIFQ